VTSSLARRPLDNERIPDQWLEARSLTGDRVFAAFNSRGVTFVSPAPDSTEFVLRHLERTGRMATPAIADEHEEILNVLRVGDPTLEHSDLSDLSSFSRRVLEAAAEIPRGETRTYQWMARFIGMPQAARAVGNALGSNPIPLVIPCHRVVRGDGTIGGYAFGTQMKRSLLAAEGLELPAAA
jgi:methylated-DNA-[protein]-cysteine S-methyltransferase